MKIGKRVPWTAEQLEYYITQELDNIPLPEVLQLVSPFPRCLWTVFKRRMDAAHCKHGTVLTFLRHAAAVKFKTIRCFFLKLLTFSVYTFDWIYFLCPTVNKT